MALVVRDRVKEQSATTGTGVVTLGGAYDGYRTFASCVPTGSVVYYAIHNTATGYESEWEVGYGTFTTAGTTLSRTTIYSSSNAGSLVNFSAGTKEVFITYPADQAVYQETNGDLRLINGVIEVSVDGTTGATLPNATFQAFATSNSYIQNNIQNLSSGSDASSDFVATNDQGSDTACYVDFGINSSNFTSASYPIYTADSGYIYALGDGGANPAKLFVGSGDSDVVIHAGGWAAGDVVCTASGADQSMSFAAAVNVTGALGITGAATFGSTVTLNADPAVALGAATKQYVDAASSTAFVVHTAVRLATAAALASNTYNNGTSGVGATLTATANGALSVDGTAVAASDRVLVKNEAAAANNGAYSVTQVGDGSTPYILTRVTDFDTAAQSEIDNNAYFYVTAGSANIGSSWILSQTAAITVGTTSLPFSLFATPLTYTASSPLQVAGTVISLSGTVGVANGGTGVNTATTGDMLYASASNTWAKLAKGTAYKSLVMDASGTNVEWNAVAINQSGAVSGSLPATNGGTGQSTYVVGDTLYSSATNVVSKLSGNATTTKKYMQQQGDGVNSAAPSWQQVAAADISGLAASATTDATNASNISSGTLPSARLTGSYTGVTGVGTVTAGTWAATTVGVGYGGTGMASYTTGDLVYASAAGVLSSLADVATGNVLISGGAATAPSYGKVGLTTHITGTLAVSNGGTGADTLSGYVYGNGTGALTASASIPNSATTATSANTASAIVARDASGNFTAGTITATLSGNATNVSGTVVVSNGGTGATTLSGYVYGNGTGALTASASIPNSATTATSVNTASAIVARDASGNFTAGTVTATLSGNATNVSGTVAVGNGGTGQTTANAGFNALAPSQVGNSGKYLSTNGADTSWSTLSVGDGTLSLGVSGTGLSGSASFSANQSGAATFTVASNATSANTASAIVARDASGNFSAGTITAALTGNATTATTASACSGNAATATTASACSGNAATATTASACSGNATTAGNAFRAVSAGSYGSGETYGSANGWSGIRFNTPNSVFMVRDTDSYSGIYKSNSTWVWAFSETGSLVTGTVPNSATTATNANTASAIVARDASGNFSAGTITAALTGSCSGSSGSCTGNAATATSATSATTASTADALATGNNYQMGSLGVGTGASGTSGEIRATNNVTAYYSDDRLKTRIGGIENALDMVDALTGFFYEANETAQALGYEVKREVGLSAQEVEKILPEVVAPAPIDDKYLTLRYERLVPLLVEAIKELRIEVNALKGK